ncbi:MAG: type II toxin-antitoxin system HicA family toxin [Bryobacteraceae bacterium]
MKLPRDVTGAQLVKALSRAGYRVTRQTGSHVRLSIDEPRQGHITVPLLRPLPVGTLSSIVKEVAAQLELEYTEILTRFF